MLVVDYAQGMKYLESNGWAIIQPPEMGKSRFELVFSDTRTKSVGAQENKPERA